MKYVIVRRFGGPEVLELVHDGSELPRPGPGIVSVEVKAAGVNYADVMARAGNYPAITTTPFRPGVEVAGVVAAVGEGVRGLSVGDAVAGINFSGGGYSSHALVSSAMAF